MKHLITICVFGILFFLVSCSKSSNSDTNETIKEIELKNFNFKSATTFNVGDTLKIAYTLEPSNTTDSLIEWSSSDVKIVDIIGNLLIAKAKGECLLTGKSKIGGLKKEFAISVKEIEIDKIILSTRSIEIENGKTSQINWTISPQNATNPKINIFSRNSSIATVTENGLISAASPGETYIVMTNEQGNIADSCKILVKPILVNDISVNYNELRIEPQDKIKIIATVNSNATNQNLIWTSDKNDNVITVEQDGTVTALRYGNARVVIKSADNAYTKYIEVAVLPVTYFLENLASFSLTTNGTQNTYTLGINLICNNKSKSTFSVKFLELIFNDGTNSIVFKSPSDFNVSKISSKTENIQLFSYSRTASGPFVGNYPPKWNTITYVEDDYTLKKYRIITNSDGWIRMTQEIDYFPY